MVRVSEFGVFICVAGRSPRGGLCIGRKTWLGIDSEWNASEFDEHASCPCCGRRPSSMRTKCLRCFGGVRGTEGS